MTSVQPWASFSTTRPSFLTCKMGQFFLLFFFFPCYSENIVKINKFKIGVRILGWSWCSDWHIESAVNNVICHKWAFSSWTWVDEKLPWSYKIASVIFKYVHGLMFVGQLTISCWGLRFWLKIVMWETVKRWGGTHSGHFGIRCMLVCSDFWQFDPMTLLPSRVHTKLLYSAYKTNRIAPLLKPVM